MTKAKTVEPFQVGTVVKWDAEDGYVAGPFRLRQEGPNYSARVTVEYLMVLGSISDATHYASTSWVTHEEILNAKKVIRSDRTDSAAVVERTKALTALGAPKALTRTQTSGVSSRFVAEIEKKMLVSLGLAP